MKQVTAIVIGGGQRGQQYSGFGLDFPDKLKIVSVAEPRKFQREKLQNAHNIPQKNAFNTWEEVAKMDKFADCVFICTQDRMHRDPAVAFAKKGYHILLEKPMAETYKDCQQIYQACKDNHTIIAVCHVLRYCPQARKIKELIQGGDIGEVVNIQLLEPIGFYHYAHSYVRGNWRKLEESSPALVAKSCHDIDLIHLWIGHSKCTAVSSFGSLKHFKKENKPAGAASRCLDCSVEGQCPYSAKRIYMKNGFMTSIVTDVPDMEHVTEAVKTGPYGRCVYDSDNNVVDNQVVNMQFEGGATVSFSMVAFTEKLCGRQVRVFGTKGELSCDFDTPFIRQFDFLSRQAVVHDVSEETQRSSGTRLSHCHGGADFFAVEAFVNAVATNDQSKVLTSPEECLYSHFLTFAAEKARVENRVIDPTVETDV